MNLHLSFFKINILLSFSSVGVDSWARIPALCSKEKRRGWEWGEGRGEEQESLVSCVLPTALEPASIIYYGYGQAQGAPVSPRETKSHRDGYFTASWTSGPSETAMLKHSRWSGTGLNQEVYHHLTLSRQAVFKWQKPTASILCAFLNKVFNSII